MPYFTIICYTVLCRIIAYCTRLYILYYTTSPSPWVPNSVAIQKFIVRQLGAPAHRSIRRSPDGQYNNGRSQYYRGLHNYSRVLGYIILLYCSYCKETQNGIRNYLGPYITNARKESFPQAIGALECSPTKAQSCHCQIVHSRVGSMATSTIHN